MEWSVLKKVEKTVRIGSLDECFAAILEFSVVTGERRDTKTCKMLRMTRRLCA